ncbi:conserved hypothetical protein [Exiguobacterium sp. 8H]|uniref:hypothetical protein n=1 Tax=unclassified Exiguobacterium TaxID=2644629 RepID=UPI0012F3BAB9|nr:MULTISPECIES: hypothetical protein [unclassified Exiguobacterium]VXA96345.1 conserved hypothetical protein [Exiguobacterium sp. 8A]VXA96921.1 conserved hypothetical protein [Exiguobacterium sp. 8H]
MRRIGVICILVLGLAGCMTPKETKSIETVDVMDVEEIEKERVIDESQFPDVEVTGTTIVEVPEGTKQISDAVVVQTTLQYEDGSTRYLSKDHILTETMVGGIGLVAMTVPDRENPFGVFIYDVRNEWAQRGMQRFGIPETSSAFVHGLDLPNKEMEAISTDYSGSDWSVKLWTLYDETHLISIIATDSFTEVEGEMSEQPEPYVLKQSYGNGLYYLSQGRLIIVTGNISEKELLTMVDSLPEPSSGSFPFYETE